MNTLISNKNYLITITQILAILSVCIAVYSQGLKGPLLLDSTKIYQLEKIYKTKNLAPNITELSFSGYAKRIVSQISLYLNIAHDQKVKPYNIKLTNLFIHIICGLLILTLSSKIVRLTAYKEDHIAIAIVSFSLWLLSPLNMSSVLYGIQRMNQLSALFSLLSCISYITLRQNQLNNSLSSLRIFFSASKIALFALLAIFSKENAIILILLFILFEIFFFQRKLLQLTFTKKIFLTITFVLAIAIVTAFSDSLINILSYETRSFSMIERLMTQSRIICLYIFKAIVPYSTATELFNDGYPVSKSLFNPFTTLISLLALVSIGTTSFLLAKHKKLKILSFGMVFFLTGHLLESTLLPLELYYEHRNYLPSFGIYLTISTLLIITTKKLNTPFKYIFIPLYILVFISIGSLKASTWSDAETVYIKAVNRDYISPRAASNLSHIYFQRNDFSSANNLLNQIIKNHPHEALRARLQIIYMHCVTGLNIDNNAYEQLQRVTMKESIIEVSQALNNIDNLIQQNKCPSLDHEKFTLSLKQISTTLKQNMKDSWNIDYYIAQIYIKDKKLNSLVNLLINRLNNGDIRSGQYLKYLLSKNTAIPVSDEIKKMLKNLEN